MRFFHSFQGFRPYVILLLFFFSRTVFAAVPDSNAAKALLSSAGTCCAALDYALPGKVHHNNLTDLSYAASLASFWSYQEASIHPTCIVIPTSSQDVSTAILLLDVAYNVNMSSCKFAVRGAGHTGFAGAANIEGGITIDTQSMNSVTVSQDRKSVSIGPGNRWGHIYPTLDAQNLSMVGGRVSEVGVGGLVLGGGVSFFSGRYGFSCDNIINYEVVLASGAIVNANATSNPDLFKALKGGSNNLAIVTRMDAKAFEQGPFWGGTLTLPVTSKEDVFNFIYNFTKTENYDPYAALINNFAWADGLPVGIIHDVEYGKPEPYPPVYQPLFAMPQLANTMRVDHLSSFTDEIASSSLPTDGHNNILSTMTFINNATFMAEFYEMADATVTSLIDVVGLIFSLTYQPLPYEIYSKSAATGGNVLGLDRFKDDFINGLLTASWTLPTDTDRVYAAIQKLFDDGTQRAKELGLFNEFVYLNYAAPWQKPITGYGAENKAFLQQVSKKYDPGQLFQNALPGGFKLATS